MIFRLRSGGSDLSTAVYERGGVKTFTGSSTISALNAGSQTSFALPNIHTSFPTFQNFTINLFKPFVTTTKTGNLLGMGVDDPPALNGHASYFQVGDSGARTGFSIIVGSGTFAGTLRVYGYNN